MKNYNPNSQQAKRSSFNYLLIFLLLVLTKFTAVAQNPPVSTLTFIYPFTDNFNTYLATDPLAFQSIWQGGYGGLGAYPDHGLNNTMDMSINFIPGIISDSISGSFGPFNSASLLSFSYRIVEYAGQNVSNSYSLTNDDYISVDFLSYPDSVSTNIAVLNSANHIASIDFQQINIPLTALAGDSGFVSFTFHGVDTNDHWIDIDNISLSDDPLITSVYPARTGQNPYRIYADNEQGITLMNTAYSSTNQKTTFKIYDLNGRILTTDSFNDTHILNTSNWSAGMYFINMQNGSGEQTQKIILQ